MRVLVSGFVLVCAVLALSACTDAYEERGLCSYFNACEYGLGTDLDNINYCKDLGSCSDPSDPTEYTISGKPAPKSSGDAGGTGGGGGDGGSE